MPYLVTAASSIFITSQCSMLCLCHVPHPVPSNTSLINIHDVNIHHLTVVYLTILYLTAPSSTTFSIVACTLLCRYITIYLFILLICTPRTDVAETAASMSNVCNYCNKQTAFLSASFHCISSYSFTQHQLCQAFHTQVSIATSVHCISYVKPSTHRSP